MTRPSQRISDFPSWPRMSSRTRSVPAPRWRWCRSTGAGSRSDRSRRSRSKTVTGESPKSRSWKPIKATVHQADPDPDVPRCFLDLKRTKEMVRGLGHALPVGLEFEGESRPASQDEAAEKEGRSPVPPGPSRASGPQRPGQPRVRRGIRPDGASGGLGTELLRGRATGLPGRRPAGELDDPASALSLHSRRSSTSCMP